MSKHAVMPLTDYVNVCDALREKTGTTDVIKSGDIPYKVAEVYNKGQLSTLKNSQYMNGKESGAIVSVNDVTPIEHNVGVKVASKNLFNLNSVVAHNNDISSDFVASGNSFTIRGNEGSGALDYNTGMLMFPYNNVANVSSKGMLVEKGVTYTVSFDYLLLEQGKYDNRIEILIYNDTLGIYNNKSCGGTLSATVRHSMSFTPARDGRIGVVFRANNNYVTISNIQIEVGTTATEYTPYVEDLTGVEVARYGKNLWDGTVKELRFVKYENGVFTQTVVDTREYLLFDVRGYDSVAQTYTNAFLYAPVREPKVVSIAFTKTSGFNELRFGHGGDTTASMVFVDISHLVDGETYTFQANITNVTQGSFSWQDVMIEKSSTSTEYEPYKEPIIYTANADGIVEGVKSISPNMTLIPNNNAVTVECEYLRDIDLYIDNLITNVALTGGV